MSVPSLLIVEDDQDLATMLSYVLRPEFRIALAESRPQALACISAATPDVVLLDLGLPPSPATTREGLRCLDEVTATAPSTKVIVLTGNTDPEPARTSIQLGAFDYHRKPVEIETLKVVLKRAAYLKSLEEETESRLGAREDRGRFEELLGIAAPMQELFAVVQRVARSDATVIIEGESGTGKELIARAIHNRSRRRGAPFIAINCGAIPESLLESELFGHEKGAFTGAHVQRSGKLQLADGGTLFLDEIGELSLPLQVKLLRVLQERTIERLGGRELIKLDLRVIAATHQDLKAQQQRGLFRPDLYYRLSVVTIQAPPLRDRGEDILLLANAFLRRADHERRPRLRLGRAAIAAMLAHSWPGNVRELENRISRALIMARGRFIEPADLDLEPPDGERGPSLKDARGRAERETLVQALGIHRGNITQAARILSVSRPTLHSLLKKHQLDAKSFR